MHHWKMTDQGLVKKTSMKNGKKGYSLAHLLNQFKVLKTSICREFTTSLAFFIDDKLCDLLVGCLATDRLDGSGLL